MPSIGKWDYVEENLALIEKWARDGLDEKQMFPQLGIKKSTWENYKNKYPILKETLKKGRQPFLANVENALAKRALGFEHVETKTHVKIEGEGESAKKVTYQERTVKYFPPDVGACIIILKNKDKDEEGKARWSNDPAKLDLSKEELELKKEMEKLKNF